MIKIKPASFEDANVIHQLAHQIYFPTYRDILSQDQMEFMLIKSYSVEALKRSMIEEQTFYLASKEDQALGFMSISEKDNQILRIEKLYLLPEYQGQGLGKKFIEFAKTLAISFDKSIIELNVNRGNKAFFFYKKMGFITLCEVDIPYYGYVLDDFVMQLKVN